MSSTIPNYSNGGGSVSTAAHGSDDVNNSFEMTPAASAAASSSGSSAAVTTSTSLLASGTDPAAAAAATSNSFVKSEAKQGASAGEVTNASSQGGVNKSSTTTAVVKAEMADPSSVASNSTTAATATTGGYNNRQYSSSYNHHQQKTHYSQWPLPPHTYAAGRQQSTDDSSGTTSATAEERVDSASSSLTAVMSNVTSSNKDAAAAATTTTEGGGAVSKSSSKNNNDNEELLVKKQQQPQVVYSSNSSSGASAPPPSSAAAAAAAAGGAPSGGPWGNTAPHPHQNPHPLHPSHPHHPHHAQYQAHYQQWYRHYAHHHHHHQHQHQQRHQQQGSQQQQQHVPPHAHYQHWHRQQQQQPQPPHSHYPTTSTQMKSSSSTSNNNKSDNSQQPPQSHHHHHANAKQSFHHHHHHHSTTIYPTRSNDSSTNGTKRNVRELSTVDSREDANTVRMEMENNDEEQDSPSSCAMSLGDFSMTSLGSSSPKGKRRKGTSKGKNESFNSDDTHNSLEFSDKEIMNNLSMNSSYSSDMAAMLYGASPTNHRTSLDGQDNVDLNDLGKTPKKNNTSSKKPRPWSSSAVKTGGGTTMMMMDDAVFRLDSMTPRFRSASDTDDGSSPALLDLIGGAETPTTGLLMSSIENAMMDDISLNRNLRGHAFTPLPHIMGGGGGNTALGSGGDASGLSITPQLSWSTNNGSPLDITPRCFGLLDSTKSTNKNPLGSPKSFWKENTDAASSDEKKGKNGGSGEKPSILSLLSPTMREMEISQDASMDGSRSTTPLPLNYGKRDQQKDEKKEQEQVNKHAEFNQNTPVHKHHPGHGHNMMRGQQQQQPPLHHQMQSSPWAQLGGYMPSPMPGAFPSMSPGFGLYPPMEPNPNDRVRNLRGRGPPVHAIPPSHRLPPPTYHHFSPLTNVMKRPSRPMYHPPHGNILPQVDVSSSSKSNCVPMKPPIPSKFQGDMNKYKDVAVPDFNNLVNFPCHMNQKSAPAPDGTRSCVMCGHSCPCTAGGKQKGKNPSSHPLAGNNQNKGGHPGMNNNFAIIPSQNKGLCTLCDVNVWIVVHSGLEIKWCKGCKNFRPWAAFGEKGLATKCVRCRERQREKYALEKEKKERAKVKPAKSSGRVLA